MLKKIISLFSVVLLASLVCALPPDKIISPTELVQIEATYNNILRGMVPETVAIFDNIVIGILPEMNTQGSMSEERFRLLLNSSFPNGLPQMTEESALFFLGYHLYRKNNELNTAEPKTVASAPMANTGKSSNMIKSHIRFDENEITCLEVCRKYHMNARKEQDSAKSGLRKLRD